MNQDIKERIEQIQKGIVPEGYKKTKVGIIPGDWEVKRLGEIFEFKNGINSNKDSYGKGVKFINVLDVLNNKYITYDSIVGRMDISDKVFNDNKVEYGDIVFQRSSETVEEAGSSNVYLDSKPVTFGGFIIRGKKKEENNPMFMNYILKIYPIRKQIMQRSYGSTRFNIGQESLKEIVFFSPSMKEQQRIASILETWDRAIELKEKLIQEKQTQKKGLINMIMKFDAIEPEPLGKYLKLQGGFAFKSSDYKEHGIPIIRISNIQDKIDINNNIVFSEKRAIEQRFIIKYGDILIAMSGATTGKTGVYRHTRIGYLNQRVGKLIPRKELLFKEFLVHLIQTNEFKNKLKKLLVAGAQPNISPTDIESIRMSIPPLPEQQRIAEILSTADREIELLKEEVELLKQQKKGLMQLLLTGIIRV